MRLVKAPAGSAARIKHSLEFLMAFGMQPNRPRHVAGDAAETITGDLKEYCNHQLRSGAKIGNHFASSLRVSASALPPDASMLASAMRSVAKQVDGLRDGAWPAKHRTSRGERFGFHSSPTGAHFWVDCARRLCGIPHVQICPGRSRLPSGRNHLLQTAITLYPAHGKSCPVDAKSSSAEAKSVGSGSWLNT